MVTISTRKKEQMTPEFYIQPKSYYCINATEKHFQTCKNSRNRVTMSLSYKKKNSRVSSRKDKQNFQEKNFKENNGELATLHTTLTILKNHNN